MRRQRSFFESLVQSAEERSVQTGGAKDQKPRGRVHVQIESVVHIVGFWRAVYYGENEKKI